MLASVAMWLALGWCAVHVPASDADGDTRGKIIGGQLVESKTEVPWLVLLKGEKKKTYCSLPLGSWCLLTSTQTVLTTFCGGSLLDSTHILSAAHCFEKERISYSWSARVGTKKLSAGIGDSIANFFCSITGQLSCQDHQIAVSKIVVNPNYNADAFTTTASNDVSIVTLHDAVPLYSDVQPVALPSFATMTWPSSNQSCVMAGWGCNVANGQVVDRSRRVDLPVLSNEECRSDWPIVNPRYQICAGAQGHDIGICPGDSGGGLVCQRINSTDTKVYVAGIASFTSATNPGQYPGVFTRVSAHIDFIKANLR